MTEQDRIADYWEDWLIDAVGGATQDRALLRGDPAEEEILTQAIVLNGKKAILNAMKAVPDPAASPMSPPMTEQSITADRLATLIEAALNGSQNIELGEKAWRFVIERLRAPAASPQAPMAWRYELAHARFWNDDITPGPWTDWRWHVSETEPNAGDAMRNVTPLYAVPRPHGGCACTSIDRSHCTEPDCTVTSQEREAP